MYIPVISKKLSDNTHELAKVALSGKWGRALSDEKFCIDDIPGIAEMHNELKAAHGLLIVAERAPLRILPGEKIVGSATMRLGAQHKIPIWYKDGAPFNSISHTTAGFEAALGKGYKAIRAEAEKSLREHESDAYGRDFLRSVIMCLEAAGIWHKRHIDELDRLIASEKDEALRQNYRDVRCALENVPEHPPRNFYEALMSLWFMFSFQRLCGNWPGIGRVDKMLGKYLAHDLASGALTLDSARELIAHFWIKGCDWIGANDQPGSGDAQHYQNVVLAGIDEDGNEVANDVTYLILDVVEELGISDFPIAVRLNANTPERLYERIADVQKRGGGIVAVYNEKRIIENLTDFGYSLTEARNFANDGCWEVQVPGKTNFIYESFDVYILLQNILGVSAGAAGRPECDLEGFKDFEDLYSAYKRALYERILIFHKSADRYGKGPYNPSASLSFLIDDCIGRAKGYYFMGPVYTVRSPHAGGLPDAINALIAIKKLVYDDKRLTLADLAGILKDDWRGEEGLRQYALNEIELYGNDDPEHDEMASRILHDFIRLANGVKERDGVLRPPGVSTFGREIAWAEERGASAAGYKKGSVLAGNLTPTPNSDKHGPTAVIRSHCALDLAGLTCGTALDLKIMPMSVRGPIGTQALVSLMKTFVQLGGIFMQIDIIDDEILRRAQAHPEEYSNLTVRVSGWSARFATLNKEWQDMIINRTSHTMGE